MTSAPKKTWAVAEVKDGGWVRLVPKFYDEESFPEQGDELVLAETKKEDS